jgi:hypothetical protein
MKGILGGRSGEESQPLTSGADIQPVYFAPRQPSMNMEGKVRDAAVAEQSMSSVHMVATFYDTGAAYVAMIRFYSCRLEDSR